VPITQADPGGTGPADSGARQLDPHHFLVVAAAVLLLGPLLALCFAVTTNDWKSALAVGVATTVAGSGFGALIGLIFGIPRALASGTPASGTEVAGYSSNTNLEQVSDWLTKLLLGAGLTQLGRIPSAVGDLGTFLAKGLGNGAASQSFVAVLVVFSSIAGFFFGYLFARLILPRAFLETDRLSREIVTTKKEIAAATAVTPANPTSLERPAEPSPKPTREAVQKIAAQMSTLERKTAVVAFTMEEYLRVAQGLLDAHLYDDAVNVLDLAAEQHSDPLPLVYAGAIRGKDQKNYADAARLYLKALSIRPDFAEAYYNLACNEIRQEHVPQARQFLEKALSLDHDGTMRTYAAKDPVWNSWRSEPSLRALIGVPPRSRRNANRPRKSNRARKTTRKGAR
jgi:tetratricopeptide (TPR) repeat protein